MKTADFDGNARHNDDDDDDEDQIMIKTLQCG